MRELLERFIVFEGLDGAGTTTQADLLCRTMRSNHTPVRPTAEPTDGPVGRLIRAALHHELTLTPDTLAYLYAADRNEHLYAPEHGIRAGIRDSWVVCDRYLFSSLAYQTVDCPPHLVDTLNASFPLPQWLFYIDVDPETCARRRAARARQELYDSISFQRRVYANYDRILRDFAGSAGMRIVRIDGAQLPEAVCARVCSELGFTPI